MAVAMENVPLSIVAVLTDGRLRRAMWQLLRRERRCGGLMNAAAAVSDDGYDVPSCRR
jgi:hypothetical protein